MYKLIIIFVFLILSISGYAQQKPPVNAQNQVDPFAELRRRIIEPPKSTKLDFPVVKVPMVGSRTLPLVEVKLNGKGPYKLLVDTGANVTLLQTRVVEELKLPNLKPVGKPILALKSLDIGKAHFQDLLVTAGEWNEKIDGVIGFNLFADCLLTMDYPKQQFIMQKGALPAAANGKDILGYKLSDEFLPLINIKIGDERLDLLIDTGSRMGVIIPDAFAAKLRFANGLAPGPDMATFATPKSRSQVGQLNGSIFWGIHQIVEPIIYVRNEEFPTVGSKILQNFKLTFDQKNHTVRLAV